MRSYNVLLSHTVHVQKRNAIFSRTSWRFILKRIITYSNLFQNDALQNHKIMNLFIYKDIYLETCLD